MKIRDRTMTLDWVQTRGTVHGLGGNRRRPIERQSIVPIKKPPRFQCLATLQLPQDACAHRAEPLGGDRIKDFAHVGVTRDPRHAIESVHIALGPLLVKGQERGRLEGKQGTSRHERSGEANLGIVKTVIWQAGKPAVPKAKERISGEMLPYVRCNDGHGTPHHNNITSLPRTYGSISPLMRSFAWGTAV